MTTFAEPPEDYEDFLYEVTLTVPAGEEAPSEELIKRVLYQGIPVINSEDAIDVVEMSG